ncbi:hypothetical protein GRI62_00860 [Erythrobacter arachoides]|uniref:Uncharacterized protein n=1 Tax=Aurantiacibacter arachoides TaxID=1850444 RepID=A0A844ZW87_9SPHN|nr:hypothetical protein [Aurantiacibacter arachoides]MXO92155.1 hypothetical protein [Aurantiacibacter arachoides]GGD59268.1 hypothetical protein GCM10011411_19350 [Aurantiacibacter arachoides]
MAKGYKNKDPRGKMAFAIRVFANKVKEYAKIHKAPKPDMAMFDEALGYGRLCNSLLASDLTLRKKSGEFLGSALEKLKLSNPELKFQFWTFTHDRGHTSDREPTIDIKFLRASADKVLRNLGLAGIYVVEVQGLGNHSLEGEGRMIMVHIHAITWSVDPPDLVMVERELNASKHWHNGLGADPVCVDEVIDAKADLKYLAYYLFKPPFDVKMMENRQRGPRLKSTLKGYRPEFAVRLLELLSQFDLRELVRASGDGKLIRTEWCRRLNYWHRSREQWADGKLPAYYFDDFWDRYRVKKKRKTYHRYAIIR